MPRMRTETLGSSNMSWLDSAHGIDNAKTEQLDISAFTANDHYPSGYIPSGTPVAKVAGRCESESSGGITLDTLREYA